jgi:hypothetical protein
MICSVCELCLVRPACQTLCTNAFWKVIEKDPDELFKIIEVWNLNITHTSQGYFELNLDMVGEYKFFYEIFKSGKCEIHFKDWRNPSILRNSSNMMRASIKKKFFYIESQNNAVNKED